MSNQQKESKMDKYYRYSPIIVIVYLLLVLFFFIAEIGAQLGNSFLSHVRATNQVLIILGLLFLPFLLSAVIYFIQRLKVKVSGVEVDVEFGELKEKVNAIMTGQSQLSGRLDDSQDVFLSILRGKDPLREERLKVPKLIIGCKDFNEQKILAELLCQHIIEFLKIDCECLIANGSSMKNYFDLLNGWIDGYIEYTGTGCMHLGIDPKKDLAAVLEKLNSRSKELGHSVQWLEPLGFTNNYVIVVEKNKMNNVKSITDLEHKAHKLTFGGNTEFMNRSDGYPGLCKTYRLNFRKEMICSYRDRYRLLKEKKVDVIDGFQTDSELSDNDLKELDDPKKFFPDYYAIPVFRKDALKIDGLQAIVNQLKSYKLDIKAMREEIAKFSVHSGSDIEVKAAEEQAKKVIENFKKNIKTTET